MWSCVRMLVCFWLRPLMALMYFEEGSVGSINLILLYRVLLFHHVFVSFFMSPLICCLTTDRLVGRVLQRKGGSRSLLLDPYSAAVLANSSAASFPIDPICPATHMSETSISGWFTTFCLILFSFSSLCILLILHLISSMRY